MSTDIAFEEADLNGYVDSRIDAARSAALARSLSSDPETRARLESWKRQNESLRTLFASVLSEPVPIRLTPASQPPRAAAIPVLPPLAMRVPGRPAGVVAATSIGAAMVGFVLGALASMGTDAFGFAPPRPSAAIDLRLDDRGATPGRLVQRAAEAHRTFLADNARPVEITAAEGPKLIRWLQHRVGSRLRVPDLESLGWTLVGGRLVPDQRGAAAFLVYGSGSDRLGLTVSHMPNVTGTEAVSVSAVGAPLGVAVWADPDFSYAITTDLGAPWLERNGGALRDAVEGQVGRSGAKP